MSKRCSLYALRIALGHMSLLEVESNFLCKKQGWVVSKQNSIKGWTEYSTRRVDKGSCAKSDFFNNFPTLYLSPHSLVKYSVLSSLDFGLIQPDHAPRKVDSLNK